jgi:hypothetical protein
VHDGSFLVLTDLSIDAIVLKKVLKFVVTICILRQD